MPRLAWLCLGFAVGCGTTPASIPRVIHGELTRGAWVPPSSTEAFVRAELAAERGECAEALELYEQARAALDDPFVIARQAEAALACDDPERAQRLIAEGDQLEPDSPAIVRVAIAIDPSPESRIARLERASLRAPELAFLLADDLEHLDRREEAERVRASARLRLAEGAHPVRRAELARRLTDEVRTQLQQGRVQPSLVRAWLRASPSARTNALEWAIAYAERGHAELAAELLMAVPARTGEATVRARVALSANRPDQLARLAPELSDEGPDARLVAIEVWLALGDAERAEETARNLAITGPESVRPIAAQRLSEVRRLRGLANDPATCADLEARLPALAAETCAPGSATSRRVE